MIYTALCVMLLIVMHPLLGQAGGGWALEILTFLGPKWNSPIGSMPFHRAQKKSRFPGPSSRCHFTGLNPLPLALVMDAARIKRLRAGTYKS
jgi:hypothetical protein